MSDFHQSPLHQNTLNQNQQPWNANAQSWGQGFGQGGGFGSAYAQPWGAQQGYGGLGQPAFGQQNFGSSGGWSQGQGFGNPWQRQLSQQDVSEIVRQLVPYLPQVVAQAQQPQAAFGNSGGYGGGFGGQNFGGQNQGQRHLSQNDVNEVVRQILPVIPQIVSLLQGQQQPYASAIHGGGFGQGGYGQQGLGWNHGNAQGWGLGNNQNQFGQHSPFGQAAFGNIGGGFGQQRQLNQADANEVVRQLTAVLPQVIANLQAQAQNVNQQRAA